MKAADQVCRKERKEIGDLRDALDRAVAQLEDARAAERALSEQAASVESQIAVSEQELMAAKADLVFRIQALEEAKGGRRSATATTSGTSQIDTARRRLVAKSLGFAGCLIASVRFGSCFSLAKTAGALQSCLGIGTHGASAANGTGGMQSSLL